MQKIENIHTAGDITRQWKLPSEDPAKAYSAYYCSANWGKEVLFMDLKKESERERVHQLVKEADIVISNFKESSAKKLQLDYDTLSNLNPRLIFAALSGFPDNDNLPAFDVVLQAEAGYMYMTGPRNGEIAKMPVALIDILAAHQLKEGILIALLKREKTGEGSRVQASLVEAALASLANQATNWLMAGHIPERIGAQHPNIAPYGDVFLTKDQKAIVLAAGTERHFKALCKVLDLEALANDERFNTNVKRVANREALIDLLKEEIQDFERTELINRFQKEGAPIGSVRNMQEVFELKSAQDMILEEKMPDGGLSRRMRTIAFTLT